MSIFSIFYFNQFSATWFFLTLNGAYFKWIGSWVQLFFSLWGSRVGEENEICRPQETSVWENINSEALQRYASLLLADSYTSCVPCGLTGSQDGASRRPWDLSFNRWHVKAYSLAEDLGILASLFDFLFGHVNSSTHPYPPWCSGAKRHGFCKIPSMLDPHRWVSKNWTENEPLLHVLPARYSVIMMNVDRYSKIPRTGLSSPPPPPSTQTLVWVDSIHPWVEVADMFAVKSP